MNILFLCHIMDAYCVKLRSKPSEISIFHSFTSNPSFMESFDNFDLKSILGGPKNPNFNPAIRMGWNQCHCKDYQIIIPKTIHGLKLELERLRYHENRDDVPINGPLTSESHNFWSDRWIFKIHTFSETGSQNISRGAKINSFLDLLRPAVLEGLPPRNACWSYK